MLRISAPSNKRPLEKAPLEKEPPRLSVNLKTIKCESQKVLLHPKYFGRRSHIDCHGSDGDGKQYFCITLNCVKYISWIKFTQQRSLTFYYFFCFSFKLAHPLLHCVFSNKLYKLYKPKLQKFQIYNRYLL